MFLEVRIDDRDLNKQISIIMEKDLLGDNRCKDNCKLEIFWSIFGILYFFFDLFLKLLGFNLMLEFWGMLGMVGGVLRKRY